MKKKNEKKKKNEQTCIIAGMLISHTRIAFSFFCMCICSMRVAAMGLRTQLNVLQQKVMLAGSYLHRQAVALCIACGL